MNNNQTNFDSVTGQQLNQNSINALNTAQNIGTQPQPQQVQPNPTVQPAQPIPQVNQVPTVDIENSNLTNNQNISVQQQMQNIPIVDQDKQNFINNTQSNNTIPKEEKKGGINITFVVILFIIIFVAILFLFPYLLNILG